MSISSISFNTTPNIQNWQAMMQQRQHDFQSLATSLKSGDLSGAQQAFSDLQAIASVNTSSTSSASTPNAAKLDFAALGQDLTAGNLSQAQKDFSQMKTDIQSVLSKNGGAFGIHHHGHHSHKAETPASPSSTSPSTDTTLPATPSSLFSGYASANATDTSMASSLFSMMG